MSCPSFSPLSLSLCCREGIPIDMVAGTSIGAMVGALYCEEKDGSKVEKRAREFAKKMARFGDKILDLTYPHSAMFSGAYIHLS